MEHIDLTDMPNKDQQKQTIQQTIKLLGVLRVPIKLHLYLTTGPNLYKN